MSWIKIKVSVSVRLAKAGGGFVGVQVCRCAILYAHALTALTPTRSFVLTTVLMITAYMCGYQ